MNEGLRADELAPGVNCFGIRVACVVRPPKGFATVAQNQSYAQTKRTVCARAVRARLPSLSVCKGMHVLMCARASLPPRACERVCRTCSDAARVRPVDVGVEAGDAAVELAHLRAVRRLRGGKLALRQHVVLRDGAGLELGIELVALAAQPEAVAQLDLALLVDARVEEALGVHGPLARLRAARAEGDAGGRGRVQEDGAEHRVRLAVELRRLGEHVVDAGAGEAHQLFPIVDRHHRLEPAHVDHDRRPVEPVLVAARDS
eukprot:5452623-Pleurochrysis_carterae.AAC.4